MSSAIACVDGHRFITSRKVFMTKSLGQIVYLFKDNRVRDPNKTNCHTLPMAQKAQQRSTLPAVNAPWTPPPPSVFKAAVFVRIQEARKKSGLTQDDVAEMLGMRQSKYAKYETRSLMPHALLAKFCEITGITLKDLLRDPR